MFAVYSPACVLSASAPTEVEDQKPAATATGGYGPQLAGAASITPLRNGTPEGYSVPASALLVENGLPGIQYAVVDPDQQYQKFLYVVIQALSGTDPSHPPAYAPTLSECGEFLDIEVPISPILLSDYYLVHEKATWMKQGDAHSSDSNARLGGIGPAIAELKRFSGQERPSFTQTIPLGHVCSELVGSFSCCNFPVEFPETKKRFYPVLVEFKLKLKEQAVEKRVTHKSGFWDSDDDDYDNGGTTGNSSVAVGNKRNSDQAGLITPN